MFEQGDLRPIRRARAATDPAVFKIKAIIHEAAARQEKRLILLTGVPGAGKTLVGLRPAHAHYLDDLAVPRENGKPSAPAVFLSGNGPLVEVLQYELRGAGGGGKTFVRGVKEYVKRYSSRPGLIPPEHVLIFDEAQRAFDAEQVQIKHADVPGFIGGKSEPEHFIEFAERIPEWCAVIGLIGSGQEIHIGEEGGLIQWRLAIEGSSDPHAWTVHGPPQLHDVMHGSSIGFEESPTLSLDTEIRFHLASEIHGFVNQLLEGGEEPSNAALAEKLESQGYHLRITNDLNKARGYQRRAQVKDPFQLRKNSYRVLLTRGRDGTVVFIPPLPELKETSDYLKKSGFRPLD
ncbi:MAG: DNA/RNA helicase domain-containing protein [Candidatus Aminicenantales bacterium]